MGQRGRIYLCMQGECDNREYWQYKILSEQLSKCCTNRSIHLCSTRQLSLCWLGRDLNIAKEETEIVSSYPALKKVLLFAAQIPKDDVFKSCACLEHKRKRWKECGITASGGKKTHYLRLGGGVHLSCVSNCKLRKRQHEFRYKFRPCCWMD